MVNFESKMSYGVYDLEKLVSLLRGPGGCPWDAEQTHESIRRNMLEEAYEAAEAIDEKNPEHLREELGDVLTQVVFHAALEQEAGRFNLDDVADAVCRKLIFRHPHVFGGAQAADSEDVLKLWDDIKRVEKEQTTVSQTLDAVAKSLPALWRAEKLQKKAEKAMNSQADSWDAMDSLADHMVGLSDALSQNGDVSGALGDVLFALVRVARLTGVDPEEALTRSSDRFTARFAGCEQAMQERGARFLTAEEELYLYSRPEADGEEPETL